MCSKNILEVKSISKEYDLLLSQKQKFYKLACDFLGRKTDDRIKKYCALSNISFSAKRGEVIGVLGKNGAGKSTLLQIICGTVTPSSGEIKVNGRLAALLELGAGFNPDFTGKENILINAAILGLSRDEIDSKYQSILDFADIGSFIEQPVKNYSSGMFMRLAFSVATSLEPDILIVDEALAVGDAKFQAKCFRRISQLKDSGTTILLVSHSTEQITRHCSKALILNNGEMIAFGEAKEVSNKYLELLFGKAEDKIKREKVLYDYKSEKTLKSSRYYNKHEHRWGNGQAEIFNFNIVSGGELNPVFVKGSEVCEISFLVKFQQRVQNAIIGITLKTQDGVTVFGRNTKNEPINNELQIIEVDRSYKFVFYIDARLCSGNYLLSIGVVKEENEDIVPLERRYDAIIFTVENNTASYGIVDLFDRVEISSE